MFRKNSRGLYFFLIFFSSLILTFLFVSGKNQITKEKVFACNLPVLFIETEGEKAIKSKEEYVDADFFIYENLKSYEENTAEKIGGKIRGRGNTTWTFRKKPYLAKLNNDTEILGMSSSKKWIIRPFMTDKSKVRDAYATYISSKIFNSGIWTPSFKFVNLYLNNNFSGLYCIYEKIEQGENRINLPENSFIFVVNSRMNKEWNFRSEKGVPFSLVDNNVPEEKFLAEKQILQSIENKIYQEDNSLIFETLDKDTFVDWYLINEFAKNRDSNFLASCFMYFNSEKNMLFMGPVWDFDIAFGGSHMDKNYLPEDSWINKFHWYKELWRNQEFKDTVKARWNEKKFQLKNSFSYINNLAEALAPSAELDDLVWRTIGRKQWPHTPGYKTRKTYSAEVEYVLDWCEQRWQWMDSYINSMGNGL